MRLKEDQADYRFIQEPDLPNIKINKERVQTIKNNLPETPMIKLNKIIKKHKIDKTNAIILTKNLDIAELYENVIKKISPKFALPWITIEWFSVLNYNKKTMDDIDIKSEHIIELLSLLQKNIITPLKAKEILRKFIPKSFSPKKEADKGGKISNELELTNIIKTVINKNPKSVEDYNNGEKKAFNFLMGQVMKNTEKRADYNKVREILDKELTN